MNILCLSVHVFVNLLADIGNNQRRIPADDSSLVFFISRNLTQVLLYDINDKVCIIIGELTNRIQQHTCQSVHGIVYFQNLRIHERKKLLIYSVKPLNLCHSYFEVSDGTLNFKAIELYFRCCLNKNLRDGDSLCRVLCHSLYKLLFTERLLSVFRCDYWRYLRFGRTAAFCTFSYIRLIVKNRHLICIFCFLLILYSNKVLQVFLVNFKLRLWILHLCKGFYSSIDKGKIKKVHLTFIHNSGHIYGFRRLNRCIVKVTVFEDITALYLINQFPVMVMCNNIKRIEILISCLLAKRQTKASSYGLHSQNIALGSIQRNDGKEVVYIPTFLQLIYMQDYLNRIRGTLNGKQESDILLGFLTSLFGVDLDYLTLVLTVQE